MKRLIFTSIVVLLALSTQVAWSAGVASRCISCHGAAGISSNPQYPNLAGQKSAYLLKQMRDFQQGLRTDPIMNVMLKGLSEQDMDALAEFYSNK